MSHACSERSGSGALQLWIRVTDSSGPMPSTPSGSPEMSSGVPGSGPLGRKSPRDVVKPTAASSAISARPTTTSRVSRAASVSATGFGPPAHSTSQRSRVHGPLGSRPPRSST
jgi:hypothetical protein